MFAAECLTQVPEAAPETMAHVESAPSIGGRMRGPWFCIGGLPYDTNFDFSPARRASGLSAAGF